MDFLKTAGAVIAGGRSARMGTDKALLVDPVTGWPFWQRQANLLQTIGLSPVLLSRNAEQVFDTGMPVVEDRHPDSGPMGGLASCLASEWVESRLLVLGVDLPRMEAGMLAALLDDGGPLGTVFERDGRYEPLVACYHRDLLPSLEQCLSNGDFRLQSWIADHVAAGRLKRLVLSPDQSHCFANVNTAADYEAFCQWTRKRS